MNWREHQWAESSVDLSYNVHGEGNKLQREVIVLETSLSDARLSSHSR